MRAKPFLIVMSIAATGLGLAAENARPAALDADVTLCREAIAKGARALSRTLLSEMAECHDARLLGGIAASVDCNQVDDAAFPDASVGSIATKVASLLARVQSACAGFAPSSLGYAACPSPCDVEVPELETIDDLAACVTCSTEQLTERAVAEVYGAVPPLQGEATDAWRCQVRYVGKEMGRYLRVLVRAQQSCQLLEDKGRIGETDCAAADLSGALARAGERLSESIARCAEADLAGLASCASSVAGEQACVEASSDTAAGELFAVVYPESAATPSPTPTPTPVADGCPDESFLDVSSAPGAGAAYADPYLGVSCSGDDVVVESNSIPPYTFVPVTPNALVENDVVYRFPRYPAVATSTSSVPLLGSIGVAVNGLPIFGPNEGPMPDPYGDPIANAIVDECLGHTAFIYHYHSLLVKCLTASGLVAEPWLLADPPADEPSPIVGYAFDGFPIHGSYECTDAACSGVVERLSAWDNVGYRSLDCTSSAACGANYTCALSMISGVARNACVPKTYAWNNNRYTAKAGSQYLDQCNGHVGPGGDYHYHATSTFPYVLGCYRGTPSSGS